MAVRAASNSKRLIPIEIKAASVHVQALVALCSFLRIEVLGIHLNHSAISGRSMLPVYISSLEPIYVCSATAVNRSTRSLILNFSAPII